MASAILSALVPYAGKFVMKNAGKLIGSGVNWMKSSKHEWLKKVGDTAGNVVNKARSWSTNNKLDKTDIGKQLANASDEIAGKDVKWYGGDDDKKQPKTDAVALVQPTAPNVPNVTYVPYNKNLGGTNFQRYRKKKYKRTKVNTSHEVMNPKFAVKGYR